MGKHCFDFFLPSNYLWNSKIQTTPMKRIILLATLIFSACQAAIVTPQSQTAKFPTSTQSQTISDRTAQPEMLISTMGIGKARLGMTLRKLREISAQNTEFIMMPSFIENVDAIAVSQKGIVQYYILYDVSSESGSSSKISLEDRSITALLTNNDDYQTKDGVKVGTSIKEAEDIYGDAVLAYNTEGESGEYITFGHENPENIKFRASYFKLISDGLGYSGIYPEYPGVSYTTDKYQDDAAIAAIEVSCDPNDCVN